MNDYYYSCNVILVNVIIEMTEIFNAYNNNNIYNNNNNNV